MSEISLREYLSDLDRLLNQHAADDVILHSRHILQYYPKIVDAYRFLGRALILNGRWDEAEAALRRVIAVIPDDYHAHVGLSEIYDRNRRGAEAIWHLERALEQNPNQSELITALRSLYKRYRNIDQAKVPMTAGAVARQAMANQSYEQAIETLRSALVRHKDRIDLRLLLAESLWAGSDPVESAEAAMDVLESLPDCLSANAIMTRLWLQEGRSSDAQRYLNRVEAVAPYLAVEIATNRPVDDDAFHIEKLDVKRSAQAELALNRPDWLQDISPESAAAQAAAEEWSSWSPAESGLLAATGTASKQDDPAPEWPPDAQTAEQSAVSLFEFEQESDVLVEGDSDSDLPEWMNAPTMQVPLSQLQAASAELSEEDDELSWLQAAENALTDDEIPSDELLFGVSDELAAQAESNGMDWLKDFEEDDAASAAESAEIPDWMIDDPLPVRSIPTPDLTDAPLPELAQDFDWAANDQFLDEALGIENLASGAPAPAEESPATIEELDWFAGETTLAQSTEESPADTTSNLGLTDIFNDPGFDPFAASPETPYDPYAETAPETGEPVEIVAEDDEWLDQVSNESAGVPGPKRGLTSLLKDANFDWMNEETSTELPSAVDQTMDDWTKQFDPAPEKADDNPAWLGTIESAETLDMAQQPDLQNEAGLTPPIQEASPTEIINPSALQSETASSSPSDDFDWANVEEIPASEGLDESAYPALDVLLGTGAAAASVDNILSDDESPVEAEPISESDLDWLSEVGVTVEESQAGESVTASEEELAALFGGADNQPQPEAGESELDWLGELDSTLTEQLEAESSADREDDLEAL
ncbi:MAG: tetratricopeptide repeat protein, partial [Anaerolineae bacterium]|nr:tetratricopeptide repeat protein [Anaerolineae bacterium]